MYSYLMDLYSCVLVLLAKGAYPELPTEMMGNPYAGSIIDGNSLQIASQKKFEDVCTAAVHCSKRWS